MTNTQIGLIAIAVITAVIFTTARYCVSYYEKTRGEARRFTEASDGTLAERVDVIDACDTQLVHLIDMDAHGNILEMFAA